MTLRGKVHKFGDHVDTDVIIPATYLVTTDAAELGSHCMETVDPDFPKKVKKGDIIVAGENFGCGSSREQAPLAIAGAGISCVVASSYARIFFLACAHQIEREALETLKDNEEALKKLRRKLERSQFDLLVKISLKKFGPEEETWDARRLKEQAEKELAELEGERQQDKEKKAKGKRLRSDIATLERRIEAIERLTASIGGVITEPEAKELILRKHYDLVADQLSRYLNAEKRAVLAVFENLWDKYQTSAKQIEAARGASTAALMPMLQALRYES